MAAVVYPPSPDRQPFIGHLSMFRRDPLKFLLDSAQDYGDIVYLKFGPQAVYLLNNPDYIKDVLVTNNRNFVKSRGLEMAKKFLGESLLTSEGEFHRRQRRLAQPAFHRQRINGYAEVMTQYGARTRSRWQPGETLDIWQEMMRLTLAIVGKTLFEADGGSMTDVQLRDEAMTLFVAGHETTANALTWTWYLLSQHPEVEARLHQEIDTVLSGKLPTADDVAQLRYTEMVFAEAMRLYP